MCLCMWLLFVLMVHLYKAIITSLIEAAISILAIVDGKILDFQFPNGPILFGLHPIICVTWIQKCVYSSWIMYILENEKYKIGSDMLVDRLVHQ